MIILGSQSPRRQEILGYFSLPFRVVPSHFDEESIRYEGNPYEYAEKLSVEKGKTIQKQYPQDTILTADTVVHVEGEVLNKPKDERDMQKMLERLSGRWHSVITAVSIVAPHVRETVVEETRVECNVLTPDEIHRYMRKHNLYDKAGSYAIQKSGSLLIKRIEGCYYNVCGLPVNALRRVLLRGGYDLWDYLKEF